MSVRRSLAWAFSGQFVAFAVQFLGLIVISRLLSPREIGVYAIAMAALGIAQVFTTFGIASFLVRESELPQSTVDTAFTVNAVLVCCLTCILTGVSFAAGPLLGAPQAGSVLRVVAISNLLAIVNFRPAALLQREMQFKQLSMINVANVSTQTLATIGFALIGSSYMSSAYASLISGATVTVLTQILGHRHIRLRFSLAGWRPITKFGLQMLSVSGIAMLTGKLSDLLLGRILGVTALGLYGRASGLSAIIFDNLYGTATRVVFVQLSKDYREGGDWRQTYVRSFSMITAVMWPCLIGIAVLSRPIIYILYGERWLPAALPLSALMVAQFIGVAFGMNWELFVLRGETGRQARYEVARLVFGVPIFAIGCLVNLLSAALAKIVDALIGLILYYPHVRRLAQIDAFVVPVIYRDGAILTLVSVVPAMLAMAFYGWSPETPPVVLVIAIVSGVALWFGALMLMRHPLYDEWRTFQRRLAFRSAT